MALGNPIQLTGNVASKMIRVIATDGQTLFTVNGGYRINQLAVFRNGVRLSNNSDFLAQDGATVVLINAASVGDEILFEIFEDFKVANAIVSSASTQTIYGDLSINGDLYYRGSSGSILTADGDGSNLTGIVSSVIAGDNISVSSTTGSVTITGLANTSIINADSLNVIGITTTDSLNVIGITTVTTLNATTGTFSGDVSIGGVLTYEDVTNIDSVGLITARSDIIVGGKIDGRLGNYSETVNTIGNTGSTCNIDVASGTHVTATLDQSTTFSFTSPASGSLFGFTLQLTNGTGGPFSIIWPGTIKWSNNVTPVRTTTDGRTDVWTFFTSDGGTNWYGSISLFNFVG
jgi:hypothetical protein